MMNEERLTVLAGGQDWTAFKRVVVNASVSEAARSFSLEIALEPGATATAAAFRGGKPLQIFANGALLFKGYVDRYRPRIAAGSAEATIEGRSLAADAIDGAAVHKTGRFEKMTPLEIAQALDKAKVGFSATAQLDKIPLAQIRPGETVFGFVERLAREQHVTLRGMAKGGVDLWDASKPQRHAGALVEGVNLKSVEASHDESGRHSHYVVRGQKAKGTAIGDLDIEAIARDQNVDRWRPTIIVVEEDIDQPRAKRRAKAHRDRAAGRSLTADGVVQGFRDDAGTPWEPGRIIPVESDTLDIRQDMLIETVVFEQTNDGSTTRLGLVDPRAYAGKAARGSKSGAAWKQDDSEAEATQPGTESPVQ